MSAPFKATRALEILHQQGCSFGGIPTASMIVKTIEDAGCIIIEKPPAAEASCDEQFALAAKIAANLGYVLVPEPPHPDAAN